MNKQKLIEMGLTPEQADAILKEHQASIDGNYVPKATFEAEREKSKKAQEDVAARDKQIQELGQFKGTAEDLQKKVETLENQNKADKEKYDAELAKVNLDASIRAALQGKVVDADDVLAKLDTTKIVLKEGKIESGLDEQLTELKKTKPHYFPAENPNPNPVGWIVGKPPQDSSRDVTPPETGSAAFGKMLAEGRMGSNETTVKAEDHYFK